MYPKGRIHPFRRAATRGVAIGALTLLSLPLGGVALAATNSTSDFDLSPSNFRTFAIGGAHVALTDELSTTVINPAALDTVSYHLSLNGGVTGKLFDLLPKIADAAENPEKLDTLDGDYPFGGLAQAGFREFGLSGIIDGNAHVNYTTEGSNETYEYGVKYVAAGQLGLALPVLDMPMGIGSLSVGASVKMLKGSDTYTKITGTTTVEPNTDPNDVSGKKTNTELQGSGMAFGVGALLRATDWVSVGAAVNNLGYKIDWEGEETTEEINKEESVAKQELVWDPATTKDITRTETRDPSWQLGVAVHPPLLGLVAAAHLYQDGTLSYGVEKSLFFGLLSLRAGQIQPGDGSDAITSLGAGVNLGPVAVGIATQTPDFNEFEGMAGASVKF